MCDPVFYCQVYQDADRLAWSLPNLRQHYPKSRIYIMSDGCNDPRWEMICAEFQCELYRGERLKPLANGGRMLHRNLSCFLDGPGEHLIKFDTDTGFHRPFRELPRSDCMFGSVQSAGRLQSIQGGCIGWTRPVVERLVKEQVFLDPQLANPRVWCRSRSILRTALATGNICEDWVLGYVCQQLDIPLFDHDEIHATWRGYHSNPDLRWAVTHPCKDCKL